MQGRYGAAWGWGGRVVEREDLIQRGLESDEAGVDEGVAGAEQLVAVQRHPRGEGSVGVVAQPLRVAHGDEEQVQRPGIDGAGLEAAFTHEAVVEPAELRGGASPAVRAKQSFLDHRGLLGRCRVPIVGAGAR